MERGFLFFWIFCYFFRNFLAGVEYERNSVLKFFSLFLGLSHPFLAKTNTGKRFFNFLNFFTIFFGIFCPGWVWTEFGTKFLFSLSLLSHPLFAKNKVGKRFFNFLNFFAIFLEFCCRCRVWTEFGTNFFFSPSRSLSTGFGLKYCRN